MPLVNSSKKLMSDGHRVNLIIGIFGICLLILWSLWAFMGKIPIFESSIKANLISQKLLYSEFYLSSRAYIKSGQKVSIELENLPWPAFDRLSGRVERIHSRPEEGRLIVYIRLLESPHQNIETLVNKVNAKATIEVEKVPPYYLLLKNLGDILLNKKNTT